jgi:hypothetical protein
MVLLKSADLSAHIPIANGQDDRICDENSLIATVAAGSSARNAEYPLKRQGDVTWRLARTCFLSSVLMVVLLVTFHCFFH